MLFAIGKRDAPIKELIDVLRCPRKSGEASPNFPLSAVGGLEDVLGHIASLGFSNPPIPTLRIFAGRFAIVISSTSIVGILELSLVIDDAGLQKDIQGFSHNDQ